MGPLRYLIERLLPRPEEPMALVVPNRAGEEYPEGMAMLVGECVEDLDEGWAEALAMGLESGWLSTVLWWPEQGRAVCGDEPYQIEIRVPVGLSGRAVAYAATAAAAAIVAVGEMDEEEDEEDGSTE